MINSKHVSMPSYLNVCTTFLMLLLSLGTVKTHEMCVLSLQPKYVNIQPQCYCSSYLCVGLFIPVVDLHTEREIHCNDINCSPIHMSKCTSNRESALINPGLHFYEKMRVRVQ